MPSKKQAVFIEHYLTCWCGAEAARLAGYRPSNAKRTATRLLAQDNIKAAIQERLNEMKAGADEVLVRLSEQARNEQAAYINADGTVDLERLIANGKAHLIKGVKQTKYGLEIEFYDAQQALRDLARTHGLFVDKIAPTTPDGKNEYTGVSADELAKARKEAQEWEKRRFSEEGAVNADGAQ